MNLRQALFWKISIGISIILVLWVSYSAYTSNNIYNDEIEKDTLADEGLGNDEKEKIINLEQKLQEKKDNKFIIADNPTGLSRVIEIEGLEDDYRSSSNTVKTLVVFGKEPNLKAIVSHNGSKHTVREGDSIAGGLIKTIDSEKLIFVKDGIGYTHYYNKKK